MAPPLVDKVYLPDLEPCLKGDSVVLSWALVASALADTTGHRQSSPAILEFLTNPTVHAFFTKPSTVFETVVGDNDPHKQAFDTRTSAVQVTPTPNDKYDVKMVKDDSIWLSKNARINLLAALRIVVIEFQSRARSQLTGPISTQDVANLQEAAGVTNAQTSSTIPGLSLVGTRDATEIQEEFEKEGARRRRIFQTYLAERRYFAMATDYLFTLMLHEQLPSCSSSEATRKIRDSLLQAYGITPVTPQAEAPTKTYHALVSQYFTRIADSVKSCEDIATVVQDEILQDDDMQVEWMGTCLTEAIHAMTVAFQLLDLSSQVLVPAEILTQWFSFVGDTAFLEVIATFGGLGDLVAPVQCLVCIISLTILNLPRILSYVEGEVDVDHHTEYVGSSDALLLIHEVTMNAADRGIAPALPIALGWVPVLHGMWLSYQQRAEQRDTIQNQKSIETYDSGTQMIPGGGRRNSAGSIITIDKTGYDDFLASTSMDRDIQPAQILGAAATNEGLVYDILCAMAKRLGTSEDSIFAPSVGSRMRLILLDLLRATNQFVGYRSEPLVTLLDVLSGGDGFWQLSGPTRVLRKHDVISRTLADEYILESFFYQTANRFPYEFSPFMGFCRTLASSTYGTGDDGHDMILRLLCKTPTLTFELPKHFNEYELAHEEENSNTMRLIEDLPLFMVTTSRKRISLDEESFVIPAGTYGRFVVDTGRIVLMEFEHSALALLGKRLEANLTPNMYRLELGILSADEMSEIISLLAVLIRTETLKASRTGTPADVSEAGLAVIAEASRALPRTKDIISVVCEILDVFIEDDADSSVLAVLTASLQFLDAILPLCPGRVWSYMARCAVLGSESRAGRLPKLVGNLELSSEQCGFLLTAIRLFANLIDSAMTSSVQRKVPLKNASRQKPSDNVWLGVSDKIVTQITLAIAQTSVDILESSSTWRFPSELQRTILIRDVVPIMNRSILYTFSMDDTTNKKKLAAPLEPAAKHIIDSFLAPSAGSLRIQPLLATLVAAVHWPGSTLHSNALKALMDRANAVLELATTLVRVANYFDRSSTTIELQLFKATPFIARVCAANGGFRRTTISLLEALVVSAGKSTGEPPSLLGYLGPQTSRAFLQLLSVLDKPFNQAEEVSFIWRFFSTIVRNRQQWMANCLLTGKTPREARNGHDKAQTSSDSVFTFALERLSSIASIASAESLAMLDFVTSAQNYWPWTIFNLQKNTAFLSALRKYVRELKSASITAKTNVVQACDEARLSAYIAETFAMQLFHLRQMGQAGSLAKDLAQDLDYFLRDGILVSGYNGSLHTNFARNFNNQYPGCTLDNFKRTLLEPRTLGNEYYYALSFADKTLRFDPGWIGPRNNGFKSEMEKANANLSLVDAQISLFHAWEFLLLELSNCLPSNDTLKKQSLQVAEQCLEANEATQGHEQIFERLTEARVNLALVLVQRVVDNSPSAGDVAQLLNALWSTVSSIDEPYGTDNLELYRTLLKLLYVTLRAQIKASDPTTKTPAQKRAINESSTSVSQTVLGILDRVVAKGFRTLVSLIHDSDSSIYPEDVGILNAIMQACLCIPGISQSQTQILNIMAAHDAVHVAISLYSWADTLAAKGDPVYGELALLFLLELSALPSVAEQLACDGILNHITAASLANYINRPNVSPFAESVGPQRCYSIWAKAIVPLLLNIVTALGPSIASEVGYLLNQFPNLMSSSVERFEAPGGSRTQTRSKSAYITLLSVSEIHSLALITRVLGAFRANNVRDVPAVEWDAAGALENVEFWLGSRKILRERLVPLGPREVEWKAMKPSEAGKARGYESRLEEKVVEQLEGVRIVLSEELE